MRYRFALSRKKIRAHLVATGGVLAHIRTEESDMKEKSAIIDRLADKILPDNGLAAER